MSSCKNMLSSYELTYSPAKNFIRVFYVFIFICVNILKLRFSVSCFKLRLQDRRKLFNGVGTE